MRKLGLFFIKTSGHSAAGTNIIYFAKMREDKFVMEEKVASPSRHILQALFFKIKNNTCRSRISA